MTPLPVSIRQPEIGGLVGGIVSLLIRPAVILAECRPGDLLWVREPFCLPRAFDCDRPTLAVARGAVPIFAADLSPSATAVDGPGLGRRRHARELPRVCHRQHLVVRAIDRVPLQALSDSDLQAAGWAVREAFRKRWDESAIFPSRALTRHRCWDANPTVLRIAVDRIAAPISHPEPQKV